MDPLADVELAIGAAGLEEGADGLGMGCQVEVFGQVLGEEKESIVNASFAAEGVDLFKERQAWSGGLAGSSGGGKSEGCSWGGGRRLGLLQFVLGGNCFEMGRERDEVASGVGHQSHPFPPRDKVVSYG